MSKLIMTKGLPASGKTTWAKQQNAKRVNKDDLRAMVDNSVWSKENEKYILHWRDEIIKDCLGGLNDVICDDTNLAPKHEIQLRAIAEAYKADFEVKDFTHVPVEECIKRDQKRQNYVGEKVIRKMYNQFLKPEPVKYVPPVGRPTAVLCDIDGTLAHMTTRKGRPYDWHRVGEDALDEVVAEILEGLQVDVEVILVSGRDAVCRPETEKWLEENGVEYDELLMRSENDNRKDTVIKKEIFNKYIKDNYKVLFVLDDRDQVVNMWRNELGLKVLQVAEGDF